MRTLLNMAGVEYFLSGHGTGRDATLYRKNRDIVRGMVKSYASDPHRQNPAEETKRRL